MSTLENHPPCPGNPKEFVWVRTTRGGHWRRKRGTIKKAVLNQVLSTNAKLTKHTNDAASRLMNHLRPHLNGMQPGRSYVHVAGKLKQAYKSNGVFDFTRLLDFDFQKNCPLREILQLNASIVETGRQVELALPVSREILQQAGRNVTHLKFQLILVHGDVTRDNGLKHDLIESDLFDLAAQERRCNLAMNLPNDCPWMLLLRVTCIQDDPAAGAHKHGMRVIRVGGAAPGGSQRIDLD